MRALPWHDDGIVTLVPHVPRCHQTLIDKVLWGTMALFLRLGVSEAHLKRQALDQVVVSVKLASQLLHSVQTTMSVIVDAVFGNDDLVLSQDPEHPANHICELCRKFYTLGWVC